MEILFFVNQIRFCLLVFVCDISGVDKIGYQQ